MSHSSGFDKTIFLGSINETIVCDRQIRREEDKIKKWTGSNFAATQSLVSKRVKWQSTVTQHGNQR